MDPGTYAIVTLILFSLRIAITIYCVIRSGQLNRSKGGWGLFGFFLPLIALIAISFAKPNRTWVSNPDVTGQD